MLEGGQAINALPQLASAKVNCRVMPGEPGAVVLPVMSSGATDGSFLRNAGIPTYGHSGLASDINDGGRIHGKDERVRVKSFYEGEDYLHRLVKMLSGGG